ncbi:MAG: hypothetical protein K5663_08385 [Clostridiales bacterium]|nr:hypothetical protein [Clostridiales bacterium]
MNLPAVNFDRDKLEPHADAMIAAVQRMGDTMLSMAGMIKATCEKIDRLEAQIKRLEKVTPEQTAAINGLIRTQADQLADDYGLTRCYGCMNTGAAKIRAMIRADIRKRYGCQVKELCRMDAGLCEDFVRMWEDTPRLMRLRRKQDEAGL